MPKAAPKNSPEHDATIEEIKAAEAAGEDPLGDDEEVVAAADLDDEEVDEAAKAKADRKAEKAAEKAAAADQAARDAGEAEEEAEEAVEEANEAATEAEVVVAAAAEPDEVDDAPTPYRGMSQEDMDRERAEAQAAIATSQKKMIAGDIEPDDHAKVQVEQQKRLDKVTREESRYDTSNQAIVNYENIVYRGIAAVARKAGLEYAENKAASRAFDVAIEVLKANRQPGDSLKSMAREANEMVLLKFGKTPPKAAAPAPAPAAKKVAAPAPAEVRRPKVAAPITLRGVPAASTPNSGTTLVEAMKPLKGAAFQKRWGALSPAQRASLLDD